MRYHVYVSACRGTSSDAENTATLRDSLDRAGLPHVACEGVYGGVKEASFKVLCEDASEVLICYFAANQYDQECILVLDIINSTYKFIRCGTVFSDQWESGWAAGYMRPLARTPLGDHTEVGGVCYQLEPTFKE